MRVDLERWLMHMAEVAKSRTTCLRRGVGAVISTKDGHILGTGYNGVASGLPHCNQSWYRDSTYYPDACEGATAPSGQNLDGCEAIHAELNALLHGRREGLYRLTTTLAPCVNCVKAYLGTTCQLIVYLDDYPADGLSLWRKAGREAMQLTSKGWEPTK